MSNTWNFPCYTCNDWGSFDRPGGAGGTRGAHGMVWAIGPEVSTLQPFTNTITGIFSFFLRSGWSDVSHTLTQYLTSIGGRGQSSWGLYVRLTGGSGGSNLEIYAYDVVGGTARNQVQLGDEDGVSLIQADKWYQVAFSMSSSAFSYAINGSTTPTVNVVSAVNGDINLDTGSDRWWLMNGTTANSGKFTVTNADQLTVQSNWPTFVVGSSAWDTNYIDLSSATVRNRIFDTSGNFKNPGENGSLWFGDTYGDAIPAFFLLDGSPRIDNGAYNASVPQSWTYAAGGGAGSVTVPGGLRKQYENAFPDDWRVYTTLAAAEASGDTWTDGDTIFTPTTGNLFIYKSDLAVDGYSGLIHKYPFGRQNGTVTTVSLKGSESANSDPDTWTDLSVKTGSGTQGIDYELDTDSSLSRMRDLSDAGYVEMTSNYPLTAADTVAFRIITDVDMTQTGGGNDAQSFRHNIRSYKDASNYYECRLSAYGGPNGSNGYALTNSWFTGGSNSFTSLSPAAYSDTPVRVWMYVSASRTAIWIDNASSNSVLQAYEVPARYAGAGAGIASSRCGAASGVTRQTMHIGTDVFGSMTIV